jgi:phospholipid-binding lipoprotein MlaA
MKLSKRALSVMVIFSLLTLLPSWDVGQYGHGNVSLSGTALAATDNGNGEEPFETRSVTVADPLEKVNRGFFYFNDKLYFWVMKPVSTVYAGFFPPGFRTSVRNAFHNFFFPIRFVNNALQGKFKASGTELARFVVNSTMGFGGMFDVAHTHFHISPRNEDLGQTFGRYGAGHGFYLVLPVLGPSSLRDGFGSVGDAFLNPLYYLSPNFGTSAAVRGGEAVNSTSLRIGEYEDFKQSALDPYVSMRSGYIQYRAEEVAR